MIIDVVEAVVNHPDPFPTKMLILPAVRSGGCCYSQSSLSLGINCLWWKEEPCPSLSNTLLYRNLDPVAGSLGNAMAPASSLQSHPSSRVSLGQTEASAFDCITVQLALCPPTSLALLWRSPVNIQLADLTLSLFPRNLP